MYCEQNGAVQPLLSVFMLTYNHERFVSCAIESILAQETDFPFELVISDDGSTDATASIVGSYAEKYPDIIKFKVNEKNLGLIANYFATVERCRGKYVALCAGDDWWLPGKAALQVKFLEENPETGMVYTRVKVFCDGEKNTVPEETEMGGPFTEYNDLKYKNVIPAVSVMMRRDLVLRYVQEIDPVAKAWLSEDFPLFLWFAQDSRIGFIDEITAVWRVWLGSISHPHVYAEKARFRASVTESGYFFARRYYGADNIPDDISISYYYEMFDRCAVEGNTDAIREYRDYVLRLRRRNKTGRTCKLMMAVKFPEAYCNFRNYILRNRRSNALA